MVKFVITDVKAKGKGMIATDKINQGELIYAEAPLLTVDHHQSLSQQIEQQFSELSKSNQQIVLNLAYQKTGSKTDIFRTNSISNAIEKKGSLSHLFPIICRANHSCTANAHWKWNDDGAKEYLIAAFDIQCGQEITVNYLGMQTLLTFDVRQQLLRKNWGFNCGCQWCNQNEDEREKMDLFITNWQQLLMKCNKPNRESYPIFLKLINLTSSQLNSHPLFLFQHHLEALKCCIGSEDPDLRSQVDYHRGKSLDNFSKFMGGSSPLPYHAKCWLRGQSRLDQE